MSTTPGGRKLRALWLVRPTLMEHPGGDTTQILKTSEALRARGCEVEITDALPGRLGAYDLVHLFHLDRVWENLPHCRQLAQHDLPIVLSPIYWVSDDFDRSGRPWPHRVAARSFGLETYRNLKAAGRWLGESRRVLASERWPRPPFGLVRAMRAILDATRMLLPNSLAELQLIRDAFGELPPALVVPNAADAKEFGRDAREHGVTREGVLCVGRIEPRKNQLALINALSDLDVSLTIVGLPGPSSASYARQCRREAGPRVRLPGPAGRHELRRLFNASRVHAAVSWYETPGLASLEAALCGSSLVATRGGSTAEYLQDDAHYCRPDDTDSIRDAVLRALEQPASDALAERVARDYSWEAAAARTLEGYQAAVEGPKSAVPDTAVQLPNAR